MWARRSPRGRQGILELVSVSILATTFGCLAFGEVMAFIEIVADKGDREEHNLGKVVTKKWRVAKSDEPGICIRFSCRDNSSFRLNTLGLLCL